ncbi:translin-associated protein X isoform X2 [Strix aluco]|uniref:translin-associated protein X isoform X2 n=1 Tax=Strix aluco TaxID=111821 RepID=UPI003DA64684
MSGKEGSGGFRKRKHDNFPHGQRREEKENVNPSSALMMSFKSFQLELDTRHDKYERLVKLSRDITIESKRTIFLLHRFTSAPNGEEILNESEVKLDAVRRKIKQVAQELIGEDMYQFHRAISPGCTVLWRSHCPGPSHGSVLSVCSWNPGVNHLHAGRGISCFLRAALNPLIAQPVFVLGIAPTHVQDLACGLIELHEVCTAPPLKPVQVPLDGSLPSSLSTSPHSLVSSANLLSVHSIPLSVSPTKMLNPAGPSNDP